MNKLFRKLFISGSWQMAYRLKKEHWPFDYDEPFIPMPNTKEYWYADPLLYEDGDKQYLFCEAFRCRKINYLDWVRTNFLAFQLLVS